MRKPGIGSETPASRRESALQDEAALVKRVASGDVAAFEALFRRYAPRLTRFLERTTRRPHLIEEILNDTMLVVWRKAGTFNRRSMVSTWILGIASRRRLKALGRLEMDFAADVDDECGPSESEPEQHLLRQDLRRRLGLALDALPFEQREVVVLTYFEGRSYAEIAAILGCPVNTVKTRMFHARRRLRSRLSDQRRAA
jgi:RNA polymerase sigma-70 factor (ECF subfamily)